MNSWVYLIIMAFSLSMDAFAVSVIDGISCRNIKKGKMLFIALTFGIMQGLMPIFGYYLGTIFEDFITDYQKWISFGLLLIIGGRMVIEGIISLIKKEAVTEKVISCKTVIGQGVATSIDALAVGVTLVGFEIGIYLSAGIIASITAFVCFIGVFLGSKFGKLFGSKTGIADIIGGMVLIALGINFLF